MNEYRVATPKGDITGFAQDPNQMVSNAGSPDLNAPLTAKSAIGVGVAVIYAKKIGGLLYNASIDQIGDGQIEVASIIGQKVVGGIGIYAVGGLKGIAAFAIVEGTKTGLEYVISGHKLNLENQEKLATRGTRVSYGVKYYD